jgi:hypothetical protein
MPILNENLDWKHFQNDRSLRNAFIGAPTKTMISAGEMLCRFITTETEKKEYESSGIYSSPWWADWNVTARMLARWKAANIKPRDVIRAKLAVPRQFSAGLDSLVQIILTQPVFAWKGIARHQEDTVLKVTYIGGGEQIFLPNLVSDPRGLNCNVAYLHCFSSVDLLV